MSRTNSFTIKLSTEVNNLLNNFCEKEGFKKNKFIENAVKREIERERTKERVYINHPGFYVSGKVDYAKEIASGRGKEIVQEALKRGCLRAKGRYETEEIEVFKRGRAMRLRQLQDRVAERAKNPKEGFCRYGRAIRCTVEDKRVCKGRCPEIYRAAQKQAGKELKEDIAFFYNHIKE